MLRIYNFQQHDYKGPKEGGGVGGGRRDVTEGGRKFKRERTRNRASPEDSYTGPRPNKRSKLFRQVPLRIMLLKNERHQIYQYCAESLSAGRAHVETRETSYHGAAGMKRIARLGRGGGEAGGEGEGDAGANKREGGGGEEEEEEGVTDYRVLLVQFLDEAREQGGFENMLNDLIVPYKVRVRISNGLKLKGKHW
eukprot:748309-Hanusia_phi.AAC.4